MCKQPWQTSLAFRLSMILACVVSIFWLISTFAAIIIDFEKTNDDQLREFDTFTKELVVSQDNILNGIYLDMETLLKAWQALPNQNDSKKNNASYLKAHYIPNDGNDIPDSKEINKALSFAEAYGSGGLGNFVDTFVILDKGLVISDEGNNNRSKHIAQINSLRDKVNSKGVYWGTPYLDENENWNVITAILIPRSKIIIGFTSQLLPPFGHNKIEIMQSEELVWLNSDYELLSPWPKWASERVPKLPDCSAGIFTTPKGLYVLCRTIKLTGWHVLLVVPPNQLSDKIFSTLHRNLMVALSLLVFLVFLLYVSLQRSLGRTLTSIVSLLTPHSGVNELKPLPVIGNDELGQMATSYNRLLSMVKEQYAELENKVQERTIELDAARLKAEKANANKSEQLTNISHEIRTPLNGIVGGLELLKHTKCNPEQYGLIDTVLKCSAHLLDIINNLLDFSRIDSGQMAINNYSLDPLPLIDQSMLTVQAVALQKKIMLSCKIFSTFPKEMMTDGLRLRQILINLLGNAVKFTPSGKVRLEGWSENHRVYIRIQDSGPGIPKQFYDDVFSPFKQLSGHVGGSGLGLPISRSLARLLGGDIHLEEPISGCSFLIELPDTGCVYHNNDTKMEVSILAPDFLHDQLKEWGYLPQTGTNELLSSPDLHFLPDRLSKYLSGDTVHILDNDDTLPPSAWSLKVLVVDDVKTNRDITSLMLLEQGQKVFIASSGAEALTYGKSHVFDLVLMDIRMPELSGVDTILLWRDISSEILDPECPIVALTANAQPGERERLLNYGFNEYLTKPISPHALSDILIYASDIQLRRGIELEHNLACQLPVLHLDPSLHGQLREDLFCHLEIFLKHLESNNLPELRNVLHTLKGISGQAGLLTIFNQVEYFEMLILDGHRLPHDAHDILKQIIDIELEKFS